MVMLHESIIRGSALFFQERGDTMFDIWTPEQREAAIAKGMAGGRLDPYERRKLEEVAKQAGSVGQRAKDALDKSKD